MLRWKRSKRSTRRLRRKLGDRCFLLFPSVPFSSRLFSIWQLRHQLQLLVVLNLFLRPTTMRSMHRSRRLTNPFRHLSPIEQKMATEIVDRNRGRTPSATLLSHPRNIGMEAARHFLDWEQIFWIEYRIYRRDDCKRFGRHKTPTLFV